MCVYPHTYVPIDPYLSVHCTRIPVLSKIKCTKAQVRAYLSTTNYFMNSISGSRDQCSLRLRD